MQPLFSWLALPVLLLLSFSSYAQGPTVEGNNLICPNDSSVLTTQPYDSYQWLQRPFGGDNVQPIEGATEQTYTVDGSETPVYISVRVVSGMDTLTSPEVLIDGLSFIPVTISTTGDFTTGPNGEAIICPGDSLTFTLLTGLTENITWFKNGFPIPDYDSIALTVTETGSYGVEAAPTDCPNYITPLGVPLDVVSCDPSGVRSPRESGVAALYPNPTRGEVTVELTHLQANRPFEVLDAMGRRLYRGLTTGDKLSLNLAGYPSGIYYFRLLDGSYAPQRIARW